MECNVVQLHCDGNEPRTSAGSVSARYVSTEGYSPSLRDVIRWHITELDRTTLAEYHLTAVCFVSPLPSR